MGGRAEDFSITESRNRARVALRNARGLKRGGIRGRVGLIKMDRADDGQLIICHDDFQVRPGFFVHRVPVPLFDYRRRDLSPH